ncbi:cellulase family glycosylhydrolase [Aquimarina algiphila]|uniref:cellulase family glycosylhydrolase n=1 Tax=Aquimarina algiphila TaxID=2047982 RepID=UPI00232E05FB|nr:cellulase family glycosylhydrolase [Aquimarina algiphila]
MKNTIINIRQLLSLIVVMLVFGLVTKLSAQQQNYLTVSGNKLFDVQGKEVRLTGVNWFGFETQNYFPHGIWSRDMKSVLQQIKDLGFNTIRVPWANEMLNPGSTIAINSYGSDPYTGVSPMNEEETKVTKPIELMDIFVKWCQENDMKIVLDNHSRAADGFLNEKFWYTPEYSEERWIQDWVFLADRYKEYSAVVAMDLNNEPHGSSWGNSNPATDWNKAAERCGNAVLQANPNVLIIIEGVGEFEGNSYWWGGQLMGARKYPIQLSDPSKLMYSAHEYGPEVAQQDWFTASDFPQNMPGIWKDNFHYLYEEGTSPLFVGEFGIKDQDAFGGISYTWFTEFTDFMGDIYSWTFWSMNPNSGDTGGILQDDWTSVNQWKLDVLKPHFAPLIPNVVGGTGNQAPNATFSASPTQGTTPLTVQFDASASSDPDGDTLTFSWDFGDGDVATGSMISHLFTDVGEYQVTLTVSDGSLNDTYVTTITVVDTTTPTVTADITVDNTSGIAPATINFDASGSTSSDGSALTYNWDFGDGTTGIGSIVAHEYSIVGNYRITLTASNTNGISDEAIIDVVITQPSTGGDCNFGAPLATALPTISNAPYTKVHVLGNGGPDLSNVTNFTINWDLVNNGLWQFSMNTSNGVPSWWNNFLPKISQNFNAAQPEITITDSGFPNLDGSYWATLDQDNFVLVSKTGGFTIYFSNSATAPACQDAAPAANLNVETFNNPVQDRLVIQGQGLSKGTTISLINISGVVMKTMQIQSNSKEVELNTSNLESGMYFVKINYEKQVSTLRIIKK